MPTNGNSWLSIQYNIIPIAHKSTEWQYDSLSKI